MAKTEPVGVRAARIARWGPIAAAVITVAGGIILSRSVQQGGTSQQISNSNIQGSTVVNAGPGARVSLGPQLEPCILHAESWVEVVSRVYGRDEVTWEPEHYMPVEFQELFYDWKIVLTPSRPVADVIATVSHVTARDRISAVPDQRRVSDLKPKWLSGFDEPARETPDYRAVTVEFAHLTPDSPGTILIRRPADETIAPETMIRLDEGGAVGCDAAITPTDVVADASRLQRQTLALAAAVKSASGSVPIGHDPGDLRAMEEQATVEVRCANNACDRVSRSQLEARLGLSPATLALLHQYEECGRLAEGLRQIIGCVEGPLCEPNRDTPCSFGSCAGPLQLSTDQQRRLQDLLTQRGATLTLVAAAPSAT